MILMYLLFCILFFPTLMLFSNWTSSIHGMQEWKTCDVSCLFRINPSKKPDASLDLTLRSGVASILRSMESASYYLNNNVDQARRWVSTIQNDLIAFETNTDIALNIMTSVLLY